MIDDESPLFDVINNKDLTIEQKLIEIRRLIDAGVNVNASDNRGWTALIFAAMMNHLEIVRVLKEAGADVNARNNRGESALTYAITMKNTGVVRYLIENGSIINNNELLAVQMIMISSSPDRGTIRDLVNQARDRQ